ncbi:MAG: hypothetical protein QM632_04400 [Micrococcaceae bacterium]
MTIPNDWIAHKRSDNELLGWLIPSGEDFIAVDLLGQKREAMDYLQAEEYLEEKGLAYLAEPYLYQPSQGKWIKVRIVEVSSKKIVLKTEDYGDITASQEQYTLAFPINEDILKPL